VLVVSARGIIPSAELMIAEQFYNELGSLGGRKARSSVGIKRIVHTIALAPYAGVYVAIAASPATRPQSQVLATQPAVVKLRTPLFSYHHCAVLPCDPFESLARALVPADRTRSGGLHAARFHSTRRSHCCTRC
jgi:hypothetical protein